MTFWNNILGFFKNPFFTDKNKNADEPISLTLESNDKKLEERIRAAKEKNKKSNISWITNYTKRGILNIIS